MTSFPFTSTTASEPFSPAFARETRTIDAAAATTIRTTSTTSPGRIPPRERTNLFDSGKSPLYNRAVGFYRRLFYHQEGARNDTDHSWRRS